MTVFHLSEPLSFTVSESRSKLSFSGLGYPLHTKRKVVIKFSKCCHSDNNMSFQANIVDSYPQISNRTRKYPCTVYPGIPSSSMLELEGVQLFTLLNGLAGTRVPANLMEQVLDSDSQVLWTSKYLGTLVPRYPFGAVHILRNTKIGNF